MHVDNCHQFLRCWPGPQQQQIKEYFISIICVASATNIYNDLICMYIPSFIAFCLHSFCTAFDDKWYLFENIQSDTDTAPDKKIMLLAFRYDFFGFTAVVLWQKFHSACKKPKNLPKVLFDEHGLMWSSGLSYSISRGLCGWPNPIVYSHVEWSEFCFTRELHFLHFQRPLNWSSVLVLFSDSYMSIPSDIC